MFFYLKNVRIKQHEFIFWFGVLLMLRNWPYYWPYYMYAKTAYYMHTDKLHIICILKLPIICTPSNYVSSVHVKLDIICMSANRVSYVRENCVLYACWQIAYHMYIKTAYRMHMKTYIICMPKLHIISMLNTCISWACYSIFLRINTTIFNFIWRTFYMHFHETKLQWTNIITKTRKCKTVQMLPRNYRSTWWKVSQFIALSHLRTLC